MACGGRVRAERRRPGPHGCQGHVQGARAGGGADWRADESTAPEPARAPRAAGPRPVRRRPKFLRSSPKNECTVIYILSMSRWTGRLHAAPRLRSPSLRSRAAPAQKKRAPIYIGRSDATSAHTGTEDVWASRTIPWEGAAPFPDVSGYEVDSRDRAAAVSPSATIPSLHSARSSLLHARRHCTNRSSAVSV